MKFSFPSGPVVLTGIWLIVFSAGNASSQTPASDVAAAPLSAEIGSASGKSRRLQSQNGYLGRAGLRPRQTVRVTVECPGSAEDDSVLVTTLDGGRVTPSAMLKVGRDGTVSFNYQGGVFHGLYRVMVRVGPAEHLLEFYVMDVEHPGNNPPRVRVVD